MNDPNLAPKPAGITPSDIFYTLFKHKWKIIICSLLGIVAAGGIYKLYPKSYSSQARLFIRYVEQGKTPMQTDNNNDRVTTLETRGDSIISSELQIISSMDLAMQIAEKIGPDLILGDSSRKNDQAAAAKSISDSIDVSIPNRSTVISVDYFHSNPSLVQPVLQALIDAYLAKHLETRSAGSFDSFVSQQAEQYRSRLARTEEELHNALGRAGVISLDEAKADQNSKIASIQGALLDSNAELASRQAMLEEMRKLTPQNPVTSGDENELTPVPSIDPNALQSYATIQARLDVLRRNEQDLLTRFTLENALVKGVQAQIASAETQKADLESKNPLLVNTVPATGAPRSSRALPTFDLNTAIIQVTALQAKVKVLEAQYLQIQKDAQRIASVETEIQELHRRKEIEEQNYRYFSESREQAKIDEAFGAGRVNNIGIVQSPTPPDWDEKDTMKIAGGALVAGLALGLAWAFLLELYIDQTIKRPIDVKRSLNIPLFLSIPDTTSRAYRRLLKKTGKQHVLDRESRSKKKRSKDAYKPKSTTLMAAAKSDPDHFGSGAIANMEDHSEASPWESDHALHPYYEALRDRLIGFFEGRGMTHKPKLIGLTGIGDAPGTTTVAAGLAGTLSQTGEGNVLLVDMTLGRESAQQFYHGKVITDLDQILGAAPSEKKNEGKLVVAAEGSNGFKLPKILPHRFNELVPKLKNSEFDYIIFDMPAVSPISVTPRLASFMDAVFLVIESEKASKDVVARATELLLKTNVNIGAILNKTKSYVPQRLQEEYLGDL